MHFTVYYSGKRFRDEAHLLTRAPSVQYRQQQQVAGEGVESTRLSLGAAEGSTGESALLGDAASADHANCIHQVYQGKTNSATAQLDRLETTSLVFYAFHLIILSFELGASQNC